MPIKVIQYSLSSHIVDRVVIQGLRVNRYWPLVAGTKYIFQITMKISKGQKINGNA